MSDKITRVSVEDWEAYYYGNLLVAQGHSVDVDEILEFLGFETDGHYIEDGNLDEFGNSFPDTLQEILDYMKGKKI